MGFLRNRATVSFALVAAGLTVGGCSGSGNTSAAEQPTAGSSPTLAACTSTFLGMSLGHRTGTTTMTQAIDLTNNGTSACVLDGYPGVDLMGVAHGLSQYTWTLRWATAPHSPVTLKAGGTAHFDVVYLPATATTAVKPTTAVTPSPKATPSAKSTPGGKPGPSGKPTATKSPSPPSPPADIEVLDISITLPNTYSQDEVAWVARLVLQDKDTQAQTYVTPFVAGSA